MYISMCVFTYQNRVNPQLYTLHPESESLDTRPGTRDPEFETGAPGNAERQRQRRLRLE